MESCNGRRMWTKEEFGFGNVKCTYLFVSPSFLFFFFSNKVGVEREKVGVFIITHLFLPMIHNLSNTIAFNGEWTSFIQERLRTVINPSYYLGRYELLVADWIIL